MSDQQHRLKLMSITCNSVVTPVRSSHPEDPFWQWLPSPGGRQELQALGVDQLQIPPRVSPGMRDRLQVVATQCRLAVYEPGASR